MGGRGASSGVSADGKKYGTEYRTVFQIDNIKFVIKNDGAATAPSETMTNGRIYVTLNSEGDKLKGITYYDDANKRYKQIDLDHFHNINGKPTKPHTQYGYYHDGEATTLSAEEQKMVDKVFEAWNNKN